MSGSNARADLSVLLCRGESLLAGVDQLKLGYQCAEQATSPAALHVVLKSENAENGVPAVE